MYDCGVCVSHTHNIYIYINTRLCMDDHARWRVARLSCHMFVSTGAVERQAGTPAGARSENSGREAACGGGQQEGDRVR